MKKYLIKISLFFIAIAILDGLFGIVCQYMNDHSNGGGVKSRYYICKESNEEVLIFGSSRAKHHYVPDIIEDSLGMTCYNTGEDGNGIILCYGFLKLITQRYTPKLIIYDVTGFDIYVDDNMKYLDLLKPYYYEPGIDSIFTMINAKSCIMMLSNFYRFNTTCLRIIGSYFHPTADYPKGYSALSKSMEYEADSYVHNKGTVDEIKMDFFEKFISLAKQKNIEVVCYVSPIFKAANSATYYQPIEMICNRYAIPFYNYEFLSSITNEKELFQDRTHLNDLGARCYTQYIINKLKNNQ